MLRKLIFHTNFFRNTHQKTLIFAFSNVFQDYEWQSFRWNLKSAKKLNPTINGTILSKIKESLLFIIRVKSPDIVVSNCSRDCCDINFANHFKGAFSNCCLKQESWEYKIYSIWVRNSLYRITAPSRWNQFHVLHASIPTIPFSGDRQLCNYSNIFPFLTTIALLKIWSLLLLLEL